jgi:hypothetical protein
VRNSSLVKWFCAENVTGLKFATEASDVLVISVFSLQVNDARFISSKRTISFNWSVLTKYLSESSPDEEATEITSTW